MPLSLRNKINIPIGLALAILAFVGVVSYHSVARLADTAHWVDNPQEVLGAIWAVKADIEDAKSSQRGYIISGNESYLSSYALAKQNVFKMLADVRARISDTPDQQKRLDALAPLIDARIASLDHTITVRSEQGFGPAANLVGSAPVMLLTEETHKAISEMEQAEYILLKERDAVEKSSVRTTKLVILLGSLLAFSLVPLAAFVINREIGKRAEAEKELVSRTEELATSDRESRRKSQILQSVLDSMGDGVAVADEKGNFILFNSAAEKILGVGAIPMPRQEWPDHFWIYLADGVTPVPADDIPLARALGGESVEGAELFVRNPKIPDGIWINVTATPLTDEGAVRRGGVAVFRDITQNKQAEQLLVQAKDEAERASKFKDQFLSTMSHELRTPLNAVLGFSDLLADERYGPLNDRQRRYVNHIHTGGKHLLKLISDILDLSKIEAGRMELAREHVAVAPAFAEVISGLYPLAEKKSQVLVQQVEANLHVHADAMRFKQVLTNLVGNAIKITPEGGRIEMVASRIDDQVRIEVRDNGPGIPADEQQRIFEAFFRLTQNGNTTEGTGLGLAITARLVELHGSKLGIKSQPGEGACFYFCLPFIATTQDQPSQTSVPMLRAGKAPRILVIEDNAATGQLIQSQLASSGYETLSCDKPERATDVAAEHRPDAITLDLLMKPVHGLEVLLQLKNDPRTSKIPVIVVTIMDQPAIGSALGADEYFIKPGDKSTLLSAVERCLRSRGGAAPARTILVVEDDVSTLEMIVELLSGYGYAVSTATDGDQARASVAESLPELVILDLVLPKMSGFELLAEWRSNPRTAELSVFVLTSKDLTKEEEKYIHAHAESLFRKQNSWREPLIKQLERVVTSPSLENA